MPKVDFYILSQTHVSELKLFACRLVEKIYKQNMSIYIHTESAQAAQAMDDMLWSFRPDSFIPHALLESENVPAAAPIPKVAVTIGFDDDAAIDSSVQVLINLKSSIPPFHTQFERLVEIVYEEDNAKKVSREHWNYYKAAGYSLQHNKI